jgi:carotenoid cleavage dioxygenase-like enzyme
LLPWRGVIGAPWPWRCIHDVDPEDAAESSAASSRAPDAQEGEGWLLATAYDERRNASHLAVLDAPRTRAFT